jgi:hypothetical protein
MLSIRIFHFGIIPSMFINFIKTKLIHWVVVVAFFLLLSMVGYLIYKDYGLFADEEIDRQIGKINLAYLASGNQSEFESACSESEKTTCYYPSLFNMILYRLIPRGDTQFIYYRQHQVLFAFFVLSTFVYYLLGKKVFKDWRFGLLAALFLVLSPRIFGYAFVNTKDIPFLNAYIIAIYTLLVFIEKKNVSTTIIHALATGAACCIRTPGLVIIPITLFFLFLDVFLSKAHWRRYLLISGLTVIYISICALFIYLFTPMLYDSPLKNFMAIFDIMKNYPWNGFQLYFGQNISSTIPWHYSIVWFAISSPLFYVLLFIVGKGALLYQSFRAHSRQKYSEMLPFFIITTCGVLPILTVIILQSNLYTDNRQMYFVYPPLLLIAVYGLRSIIELMRSRIRIWRILVFAGIIVGIISPVYFMARYHPYQTLYFNFLAGFEMSTIKERFSLAASRAEKESLEYILRTDPRAKIRIYQYDHPQKSVLLLSSEQRSRLIYIDPEQDTPDYVMVSYRLYPEQIFSKGLLYYSVRIGDTVIYSVYKMDN